MKKRSIIFFCFLLFSSLLKSQDITGDWYGMLEVQGMKLRIVFHINKEGERLTATLDSPDQSAFGIEVDEITFQEEILNISLPKLFASYHGTLEEEQIKGIFTQMGAKLPLDLQRQNIEKPVVHRPQEPTGRIPYYEEEIMFPNIRDNIKLGGTITMPGKDGKYPFVVLISGSGPQNRNEELLNHKPFLIIADHLSRHGIGVLRFDDRGVGQSEGDHAIATTVDFATDVLAAVAYLKAQPYVDQKKIGLVGHSEGGLIAPMAAAKSADVSYIVLLAGPGVSGDEIILLQQKLIGEAEGTSEKELKENNKFLKKAFKEMRKSDDFDEIKAKLAKRVKKELRKEGMKPEEVDKISNQTLTGIANPWFKFFIDYDPAQALRKVQCPVLALNGDKDLQVDYKQNLFTIRNILLEAGNHDVTTKVLPSLNHLFQTSETGKPSEYGKLEETFSPAALNEISSWILSKTR